MQAKVPRPGRITVIPPARASTGSLYASALAEGAVAAAEAAAAETTVRAFTPLLVLLFGGERDVLAAVAHVVEAPRPCVRSRREGWASAEARAPALVGFDLMRSHFQFSYRQESEDVAAPRRRGRP